MNTADEINKTAVAIYLAREKDREEGGQHHSLALMQSLPWERLRPAIDLVFALCAIDIETHSKDVDADAADMAKTMADETGNAAACAADIARIAHRHPSEVSLKVARNLMDHAIDQLDERKAR